MRRREFVTLLGGAAAVWPIALRAQQRAIPVIGYLESGSAEANTVRTAGLREGLSETGYDEGKNLVIEYRFANGAFDRLPALARDLVDHKVAVISTGGLPAALAAKAATKVIPIVFYTGADPIQTGLVENLNHPGANVTGAAFFAVTLEAKKLELLRMLIPEGATIAMLVNPGTPNPAILRGAQEAADAVGQKFFALEATTPSEIDAAFATLAQRKAGALIVAADSLFNSRRVQIITLAAQLSIPAIYYQREFVAEGGLMSYGASLVESFRQAGVYVGRILNGEKPGDLPVQQATKFELVINLKTAKALGLNVPPVLLALATEVIE
jgi:putative tryptophan/tyrosine transport system substrate-binding protein